MNPSETAKVCDVERMMDKDGNNWFFWSVVGDGGSHCGPADCLTEAWSKCADSLRTHANRHEECYE